MKRIIEVEDSLEERVDRAIEGVEAELRSYLEANPDTDDVPDLSNDLDYSGAIEEIVDGKVPIYTREITDTWYFHTDELEEAYENAGVGYNPRENCGMAAIYFYIQQEVSEWYEENAREIFENWKDAQSGQVGQDVDSA